LIVAKGDELRVRWSRDFCECVGVSASHSGSDERRQMCHATREGRQDFEGNRLGINCVRELEDGTRLSITVEDLGAWC